VTNSLATTTKPPTTSLAKEHQLASTLETSRAPALSRAVAVLRVLGESPTPLGVQAIARELGLVPSTCFYLLKALVSEELVTFDADTKRYSVGPGVLTLAQYWFRRHRFPEQAQPHLDRISQAFDVTVVGAQIVGLDHVVIVAVSQTASQIHFSTHIGSRFPGLTSATGRCVAAFGGHSEADLEVKFRQAPWDRMPAYEEWQRQVAETRERGFAVDDGDYLSDITVVSAPVFETPGRLTHSLVAIGFSGTVKRKGLPELEQALLAAARTLSRG
jgi:DNA-binding IclR family transcriptional regulator